MAFESGIRSGVFSIPNFDGAIKGSRGKDSIFFGMKLNIHYEMGVFFPLLLHLISIVNQFPVSDTFIIRTSQQISSEWMTNHLPNKIIMSLELNQFFSSLIRVDSNFQIVSCCQYFLTIQPYRSS